LLLLRNDNPYASRRLKNRPQCRSVKGGQEGKGKDRESKRGFLGISFPLSPRDHSAAVGVLGKDRDKSKHGGDFNDVGNLAGGKGAGSSPDGARIAWLHFNDLLQDRRRVSLTTANELIPIFWKISSQYSPIIPKGRTHRRGFLFATLPYSHDQSTVHRRRKNKFLQQAASTGTKFDKPARRRLEQRRLGIVNWVP